MSQLQWTRFAGAGVSDRGPLPVAMHASDATALPLLALHGLGADLIRFPPGGGVERHRHPGAHLLFVLSGCGFIDAWFEAAPETVELTPGVCYLVPGWLPHAIRAQTELTLISIGNDHRPADSVERLEICP